MTLFPRINSSNTDPLAGDGGIVTTAADPENRRRRSSRRRRRRRHDPDDTGNENADHDILMEEVLNDLQLHVYEHDGSDDDEIMDTHRRDDDNEDENVDDDSLMEQVINDLQMHVYSNQNDSDDDDDDEIDFVDLENLSPQGHLPSESPLESNHHRRTQSAQEQAPRMQEEDEMTMATVDTGVASDQEVPNRRPAVHHQEKQGGKCCGFCCDYRRAVLILGVSLVATSLLDVIFFVSQEIGNGGGSSSLSTGVDITVKEDDDPGNRTIWSGGDHYDDSNVDDDDEGTAIIQEINKRLQSIRDAYRLQYILLEVMGVVFGSVSILAAWSFSKLGTTVSLVYAAAALALVYFLDVSERKEAQAVLQEYEDFDANISIPIIDYCITLAMFLVYWYPSIMFLREMQLGIMTRTTYVREDYSCCCH